MRPAHAWRGHSLLAGAIAAGVLFGCAQQASKTALVSPPGQLFCAIATQGGGQIIARVIEAKASTAGDTAGALAILATGMGQAFVQSACQDAAAAVGGVAGVPVSPPPDPSAVAPVAIARPVS